jgi:hypothetical protein
VACANFNGIEAKALHLSSAFATQGFVLEDVAVEDGSVRAVVRDTTDGLPVARSIHASQFIFALWKVFPRDTISVEYRTRDGSGRAVFESKGKICQAIREGAMDPTALAETMDILPA